MKIQGRIISGPKETIVAIPRDDGDIIFKLRAVLTFDEFDVLCPEPVAPTRVYKDGRKELDIENADYVKLSGERASKRWDWMILKSLSATEGLEWETVDMAKPDTYTNYLKELNGAGFTTYEIQKIIQGVIDANGLDETKYKEARERFMYSQVPSQP